MPPGAVPGEERKMKLQYLVMGDQWGDGAMKASAKVKTESGLTIQVDFTAQMSAELAQAAAEIGGW